MDNNTNYIINFLKRNGFSKMETNSYANDKCNVVISSDSYAVANNNGDTACSNDLDIYWLIGYLTYYSFIEKDYKK